MLKTQDEADWDMDNDSDLQGGRDGECSEEEGYSKAYFGNQDMWTATQQCLVRDRVVIDRQNRADQIHPFIEGIGGYWGLHKKDTFMNPQYLNDTTPEND